MSKATLANNEDLTKKIGIGVVWMFVSRWVVRLLGLVSTAVLARVLSPDDFGLIAMAGVFTAMISAFTQMEMDQAIIRLQEVSKDYFDTVFTLKIITGCITASVILGLSWVATDYYNDERIGTIMRWLSLTPLISALSNPKCVLFRKNLTFHKDFNYSASTKLISVIATISLALYLNSYWALVYGILVGSAGHVLISYIMLPYLPQLSLARAKEIFSFSVWLQVRNVGIVSMSKIEQFVIGANFGPERTSYYYIGSEVGQMVTGEVALPVGRALMPGFSLVQDDSDRLRRGLLSSFAAILIVLPIGFGVAALAPEFITVVFGAKWLPAAPILEILSISGAIGALSAPFGPLLMVKNKVKEVALVIVAGGIIILLAAIALKGFDSLEIIASSRMFVQLYIFLALMYLAMADWKQDIPSVLTMLLRPLAISYLMYLGVKYGQLHFDLSPVYALLIWPVVGALFFSAGSFLLWFSTGKPEGMENVLLSAFQKYKHRS